MVGVKAIAILLAAVIVVALSTAIFSWGVTAQNSEDSDVIADPYIIIFSGGFPIDYRDATPSIYIDAGSAAIRLKVGMPVVNSMFIISETITSVSYKASWLSNRSITLLGSDSEGPLFFDLDGIPCGYHHIEVFASGHVTSVSLDFSSSRLIYGSNAKYFNFTVAPNPTPTPEPESFPTILVIASSVATAVLIGLGLLLYGIKRK